MTTFPPSDLPALVSSRWVSSRQRVWRWGVLLCIGLLSFVLPEAVHAQEFGRIEETETNAAYFFYAEPGQATVQVSLWGTLGQTGIYEVPDSTGLDRLLTLAGGAPIDVRRKGQDPARITVRLYRPQEIVDGASGRELILEVSLEEMLRGEVRYPILKDNDIVVVETIQPRDISWRDVLSVVTSLGTLTLLALRLNDRL